MDEYLIEAIMRRWKIKNKKLAEERAKIVSLYLRSRGLLPYKKDLEKCFGRIHVAEDMVKYYEESVFKSHKHSRRRSLSDNDSLFYREVSA